MPKPVSLLFRAAGTAFVLAAVGALGASCSSKKNTQLMLSMETDLKVPKDINFVVLDVESFGANQYHKVFRVDATGTVHLPATLGVTPNDTNDLHPVTVRVTGGFAPIGTPDAQLGSFGQRVIRSSRLSFALDRIALVRMPIHFACLDKLDCGDTDPNHPLTCIAGQCVSPDVDVTKLPDYTSSAVPAPAPPGSGDSVCFDGDKCLAGAQALGTDLDGQCTYDVSGSGGAPKAFDVTKLTLAFESAPGGAGFCTATACRTAIDFDADEGWSWVDANGKTQVRLAAPLCKTFKAGKIGKLVATDACETKSSALPLCDVTLPLADGGFVDSSIPPTDGSASDATLTDATLTDGSASDASDALTDATLTDATLTDATLTDGASDVGSDAGTDATVTTDAGSVDGGGDASTEAGVCAPISASCQSCMQTACSTAFFQAFGASAPASWSSGDCAGYVACAQSMCGAGGEATCFAGAATTVACQNDLGPCATSSCTAQCAAELGIPVSDAGPPDGAIGADSGPLVCGATAPPPWPQLLYAALGDSPMPSYTYKSTLYTAGTVGMPGAMVAGPTCGGARMAAQIAGTSGLSLPFVGSTGDAVNSLYVSIWFNNNNTAGTLISQDIGTGSNGWAIVDLGGGAGIQFQAVDAGGAVSTPAVTYTSSAWHHFEVVYSAGNVSTILDGAMSAPGTATAPLSMATKGVILGANGPAATPTSYFQGGLAEVYIYGN